MNKILHITLAFNLVLLVSRSKLELNVNKNLGFKKFFRHVFVQKRFHKIIIYFAFNMHISYAAYSIKRNLMQRDSGEA